jgi:ornithine cyclodeaminase/alanine dehydrogenase
MPVKTGVAVYPAKTVEETVSDVDMIITCTQKLPNPIIPGWAMKPGMMGVGIEAGRAWPAELIHGCDKVITDDIDQTSSYATTGAFAGGIPPFYCQLGDLVNGKAGRESEDERIMVFNLGIAACDISLGNLVVEKAMEHEAGMILTLMERDF